MTKEKPSGLPEIDEQEVANNLQDLPKRTLSDQDIEKLSDMAMLYVQTMTGMELYPYQYEFGWRIVYSLLVEDSDEISALFARQMGKCLAEGTQVLMYDGTQKNVEDVGVGDLLMGDDSTPRTVLSLAQGAEDMYTVVPNSNAHEPYTVNESHILSLKKRRGGETIDLPISEVRKLKQIDGSYLGYKVAVDYQANPYWVDPYWLGCWLGDGTSRDVGITTSDPEVVEHIHRLARESDMCVSLYEQPSNCDTYAIVGDGSAGCNPYRKYLQDAGLIGKGNKHIPFNYLVNSRRIRLELLAGLIDSDGHIGQDNCCELTQKNRQLTDDIRRLVQSLGFRVSLRPKVVKGTEYYKLWIYGPLWEVPTKVPRKTSPKRKLHQNPLNYGFTLRPEGPGRYYGFEIDGNKRFLLGDHTVTHNTETVANVVVGCMVLLPVFARNIAWDDRIAKFKDGVWVGIYAPNYEQAGIMWSRMKSRLYSNAARSALLDPDIDIDLDAERENMCLPNGSFVDSGTASPQSSIEGKTYHLILLEETQDIPRNKILESIHPMAAATAGTLVKIGTPNRKRSEFYEACRRNKRTDLAEGIVRSKKRRHFEFDYTVGQKHNPRYRKYIIKEKARLGEDSDEFRMKYRLHFLLDRGMFVNPDILEECGIKSTKDALTVEKGKGRRKQTYRFLRPANVVTYDQTNEGIIAAIDVGREASTVVTVGKVFWDAPVEYADSQRFPVHILNWLELQGDDHEAQHPQIIAFLQNYKMSQLIIDATGKGDPVYSRLCADLEVFGIYVQPFIFNASSKDIGYKTFGQELASHRFTYPAGARATSLRKWQRFVTQMEDLEKEWRGQQMVVHKPKGSSEARDDYCDSAMMLCWLANVRAMQEVEEGPNPLLGRQARWVAADTMKTAKAWFRNVTEPKLRPARKGRGGKWD